MNENIWALDKEQAIKHLLLMLTANLGGSCVEILDRRDGDPRAITLCSPDDNDIQAYISRHGQDQGKFGIHLAFPDRDDISPTDTEIICENVSLEQAIEMLAIHFDADVPEASAS